MVEVGLALLGLPVLELSEVLDPEPAEDPLEEAEAGEVGLVEAGALVTEAEVVAEGDVEAAADVDVEVGVDVGVVEVEEVDVAELASEVASVAVEAESAELEEPYSQQPSVQWEKTTRDECTSVPVTKRRYESHFFWF
ncbi:hypothetical protein F5050DRAFT_1750575 [Lentinula boryana]|uniref:Uncharacterized protein n=1 Tax=Lentinula boryana TaxID=40481 RepID=A0ABQ8QGN7_9AGAR|nr:hypothetical protein F5050DRAFT_1750575 [Lentinula boryana]